MAGDIVIRAEGLGKKYTIGREIERCRYTTLRDAAAGTTQSMWKWAMDAACGRAIVRGQAVEEFWALKDVNFEVKRGEVIGIIGRNGAGKSTLLKILSRITEPAEGYLTIAGRVAGLLEVGTGFHPELTGRQNIYLNGAILGMSRAEIRRKFDQIVDFSGVEKFIDTPVKRYSSGMYVRLAFAVAAHLEPEILVVDEVLAVGDAEFQKKCLGTMGEMSTHDGRTVLFVSHNMAAIQTLCQKCIVMDNGRQTFHGPTKEAIDLYLKKESPPLAFEKKYIKNEKPQLIAASIQSIETVTDNLTRLALDLGIYSENKMNVNIDVRFCDHRGVPIGLATLGATTSSSPVSLLPGNSSVGLLIDITHLVLGTYSISIDLTAPCVEHYDRCEDCLEFTIGAEHWPGLPNPIRQDWQYGSSVFPCEQRTRIDGLRSNRRNPA